MSNNNLVILISSIIGCLETEISNIRELKNGMTNHSFVFEYDNNEYIIRIPGEGSDELINRKNEYKIYQLIKNKSLCDDPVYINPENGIKICIYYSEARTCDVNNKEDLRRCIKKLYDFHQMNLKSDNVFDLFEQIDFYESLRDKKSIYIDYEDTKKNILSLQKYIKDNEEEYRLCHIDAVADNYLIIGNDVELVDWEYAGMQDRNIDIAMFAIYSMLNKEQIDELIDLYYSFESGCNEKIRIKIYCYIAACGLLWSNWCEYKKSLGIEFGEYSIRQYQYARDYYEIVKDYII